MTTPHYKDHLGRLAQVSFATGIRLVRLTGLDSANVYHAVETELDAAGQLQTIPDRTLRVINLGEPADADGQVPAGTDAVAVDVEGRWFVVVRRAGSSLVPAKVISGGSGGSYTVRPQEATGAGSFSDRASATDLTAWNLSEMTLGPGSAAPAGTIVLVTELTDTDGASRYVFDHPAYAKYLD